MGLCSFQNFFIFWSAIFLGFSYFLYTPVPHGFTEPWKLRTSLAAFKTMNLIAGVGELLGYDSSINITRKLSSAAFPSQPDDPSLEIWDATFDGVPVRIYKPINIKTPAPAMVFIHGGGWVLLSVDVYDFNTRLIAKQANIIVVSVEYRLAPEYPFPIPFDDCVTATTHLLQNGAKYGVDPKRVAIAGDSAGGNLAAAVAQRLSYEPETFLPKLKLQLLVYPCLQASDFNLPSYLQNGGFGGMLTKTSMIKYWILYMGLKNLTENAIYFENNLHTSPFLRHSEYSEYVSLKLLPQQLQDRAKKFEYKDEDINTELASKIEDLLINPYFSPLMAANLSNVAPAYIVNAEFDVLRDEGLMYGQRLRQAGVKVHMHNVRQAFHGFVTPIQPLSSLSYELGLKTWDEICTYLKKKL